MEETVKNKGGRPKITPHKCHKCNYTTKITTSLKKHYLSMHATEEEKSEEYKYYCSYCKVGFMTISASNKHNSTTKHQRLSQID